MYMTHTCPRCAKPIEQEQILGNIIYCSCGWNGHKSQFEPEKKSRFEKIILALSLILASYMVYSAQTWGKFYPERLWYKTLSTLKINSAKDEARMAFICKMLEKHHCAAQSYTMALNKSPKSYNLAGALGIELSIIGEYDQAILTFQSYFSHSRGNHEHKHYYAKALSAQDSINEATEWYYKSLQQKPESLETAKELILHLVKNELYTEALSIIGYYNKFFPKTRKAWHLLSMEVKQKYTKYSSQYKINEMKIMGLNKYLYAPVAFSGTSETFLFMVDPESGFFTIDLKILQNHKIAYKKLGNKEVVADNGRSTKGMHILLPELKVGPFLLRNVKALACENCALLLGKDIMKRLNPKTQEAGIQGIRYITLKQ